MAIDVSTDDLLQSDFAPLEAIIRARAAEAGAEIALQDETSRLSWRELDAAIDRIAAGLQRDRTAIVRSAAGTRLK